MTSQKPKSFNASNIPNCVRCSTELVDDFQLIFDDTGLELELQKLLGICFDIDIKIRLGEIQALCEDCLNELIDTYDVIQRNEEGKESERAKINVLENEDTCEYVSDSDLDCSKFEDNLDDNSSKQSKTKKHDSNNRTLKKNPQNKSCPGTSKKEDSSKLKKRNEEGRGSEKTKVNVLKNEGTAENDSDSDFECSNFEDDSDDDYSTKKLGSNKRSLKNKPENISRSVTSKNEAWSKCKTSLNQSKDPPDDTKTPQIISVKTVQAVSTTSEFEEPEYFEGALNELEEEVLKELEEVSEEFEEVTEELKEKDDSNIAEEPEKDEHLKEDHGNNSEQGVDAEGDFNHIDYLDDFDDFDFKEYKNKVLQSKFQDVCFPEGISCRICSDIITSHVDMTKHTIEKHCVEEFAYPCIIDDKCESLATEEDLSYHLVFKHYDLNALVIYCKCPECDKRFNEVPSYNKHSCYQQSNISKRRLDCDKCGQAFTSNKRYRFHLQFHLKKRRPKACIICDKLFRYQEEFFEHVMYSHDKINGHLCLTCDRVFTTAKNYKQHEVIHTVERPYSCLLCSRSYIHRHSLNDHMVSSHGAESPYKCHVCGEYFVSETVLNHHIKTHNKPKPTEVICCNSCGFVAENEKEAENHLEEHEDNDVHTITEIIDKAYCCEYCELAFNCVDNLVQHRILHSKKVYYCAMCSESFEEYKDLKNHKFTHKDYPDKRDNFPVIRHYVCDVPGCLKSYMLVLSLKAHKKQHNFKRPVKCPKCKAKFETTQDLNEHMEKIHNGFDYHCEFCSKVCSTKHALGVHMTMKHSDGQFHCDSCNFSYATKELLDKHTYSMHKDLPCVICGIVLKTLRNHQLHMRVVHEKERRFFCKYCNKGFFKHCDVLTHEQAVHLKVKKYACHLCPFKAAYKASVTAHIRVHRNETPFTCNLCGKGFRKKYSLNIHLKRHNNIRDCKCPYEGCESAYSEKTSLNLHIRLKHGDGSSLSGMKRKRTADATRSFFNVPKSEIFVDDDDGLDFGSDEEQPKNKVAKEDCSDEDTPDEDNPESDDLFDDGLDFDSAEEAAIKINYTKDDSSDKRRVNDADDDDDDDGDESVFKENSSSPAVVVKKNFSDHDYIVNRGNVDAYGDVM